MHVKYKNIFENVHSSNKHNKTFIMLWDEGKEKIYLSIQVQVVDGFQIQMKAQRVKRKKEGSEGKIMKRRSCYVS